MSKWHIVTLFEDSPSPVFSELENCYSVECKDFSERPYVFFDTDPYAKQRAEKLCKKLNGD